MSPSHEERTAAPAGRSPASRAESPSSGSWTGSKIFVSTKPSTDHRGAAVSATCRCTSFAGWKHCTSSSPRSPEGTFGLSLIRGPASRWVLDQTIATTAGTLQRHGGDAMSAGLFGLLDDVAVLARLAAASARATAKAAGGVIDDHAVHARK